MDFENRLKRLEEIVHSMEAGDIPLERSLQIFEEGVKLARECTQQLNDAESKVKMLLSLDDQGQMITQDFVPET